MTKTPHTLLDELEIIDAALLDGTATEEQEAKGQQIVSLANPAPELLDALDYFFNIMHDYQSSLQKGYVKQALQKARRAIAKAKGDCV
jgi:hypothetical protein